MHHHGLKLVAATLILGATSGVASGATASYFAQVDRIISDDVNFGGCMAVTVPGPQSTGLTCGNNFVTFDCTADFGSKSAAQQKLSAAQLAFVTNKQVRLVIDDAQTHNGYCFVRRIDNTNTDNGAQ